MGRRQIRSYSRRDSAVGMLFLHKILIARGIIFPERRFEGIWFSGTKAGSSSIIRFHGAVWVSCKRPAQFCFFSPLFSPIFTPVCFSFSLFLCHSVLGSPFFPRLTIKLNLPRFCVTAALPAGRPTRLSVCSFDLSTIISRWILWKLLMSSTTVALSLFLPCTRRLVEFATNRLGLFVKRLGSIDFGHFRLQKGIYRYIPLQMSAIGMKLLYVWKTTLEFPLYFRKFSHQDPSN